MKEIEVKAKVKNKEALVSELKQIGCELSVPIVQTDTCYATSAGSLAQYLKSEQFLRIRKTNDGRYIFTVKQPMKQALSKIEHETEVINADELEQALFLLGYKKANKVEKSRQTTHYKDYEICLDEVTDLGSFIEVEKFSEDDPDAIREELFSFLMSLGVLKEDEVNVGYDILIMKKNEE
jgi:adenylate cyclase class 2